MKKIKREKIHRQTPAASCGEPLAPRPMAAGSRAKTQEGFALVAALMFLVILTIIGLSATSTTTMEQLITRNDRVTKEAFYEADGGIEIGIEMARQNLICAEGFMSNRNVGNSDESLQIHGIEILDPLFWDQDIIDSQTELAKYPSDDAGYRDVVIPARDPNDQDFEVHTNLAFFGEAKAPNGNSIPMSSGYAGPGKAMPSGSYYIVEIHSQQFGKNSSVSIHAQQWLQKIDEQGDCDYGEL